MAAIASNGTGGGLWSDTATWTGGAVPVDGDSVTIALGDTVTFDVDQSGFATGLAGLVCTGIFQCSTTAGTYHLKMAGNITGAGSFLAGTAETPLPMTVKFNIQMNGARQFSSVGTLKLYGTNPTNTYVKLTALEPIAETVMAVDTDVTTDIWAAGDIVRLCDINKARESEQYTIAGGGIAAGTITLTAGLSAAKSVGAYLVLCSRNIRIYGHTANNYAVLGCQYAVLQCEIYGGSTGAPSTGDCGHGVFICNYSTFSGCIHGCSYGLRTNSYFTCTGVVVGCYYGGSTNYDSIYGGLFAGHQYSFQNSWGSKITALCIGCNYGVSGGAGIAISGNFIGNTCTIRDVDGSIITGILNDNQYGLYGCNGCRLYGAVLTNTTDIYACSWITGIGASLNGNTQVSTSTGVNNRYCVPAALIWDIGGVSGTVKAWMTAGSIATDAATFTTGITQSHKATFSTAVAPLFLDWPIWLEANESLSVTVYMKQDGTGRTEVPRCQVIDPANDPLYKTGGAVLSEQIMADNTNWQTFTLSHTATGAGMIHIRVRGTNASGNFWGQMVRTLSSGGSSYDGPACPKTVSGAMYPRMS